MLHSFKVLLLLFHITAVRVGFEMAQYSVEEAQGTAPITIRIVREDNFTSTHDFNIWLMIGSASSATIGM